MLVGWYSGKIRSDKGCIMYDKKCEKQFKSMLKEFIDWLTADYDAEEYDEEAPAEEEEPEEAQPKEAAVESEHERQQRELIEEQQRKLKDQLAGIKPASTAATAQEEQSTSTLEPAETKIDATAVEVNEEFDVDDI